MNVACLSYLSDNCKKVFFHVDLSGKLSLIFHFSINYIGVDLQLRQTYSYDFMIRFDDAILCNFVMHQIMMTNDH